MVLKLTLKIKPRDQLWEKKATVRRSWCQKLGPSAPNISSAHRKWFCWCHILHFSTSRHFFVSKICCPLFWQKWHCYVGCPTLLQPQEYTWDKGLLLMINVADWNIVSHLLSPKHQFSLRLKKNLAFLFPSDCALLSWFEQLVHTCYLLWQKRIFHICADQRYRDMQHRWITCPCLADRTHFSLIIPDENVNISRNQSLMEASWQEQLKWYVG